MTPRLKWFDHADDWEKIRKQLLKDRLTKEWFEKETIERLFDVKIRYASKSEFKSAFYHNLNDNSFVIGKEALLETVRGDFAKALPYTILTQTLLGVGYFSLRNKAFRDSVGPKIQSVLETHLKIANGIIEVSNEEAYIDNLYVQAFGRGSPIIDDLQKIFKRIQKSCEEGEKTVLTEVSPPPDSGHLTIKVNVKLYNLMTKYETSRSVAVTHFYTKERASREGPNSVWQLANELMNHQVSDADLSPYLTTWKTYGPGKNFIQRVEDFRLGEDSPKSYSIPVS
jgi:hypothetical protein